MKKHSAIPEETTQNAYHSSPIPPGYMRIGEIAKKAGVTVRTLSYYDKEGLLTPQTTSESGYRLYTDKDFVKLIQILMMKRLGFTLNQIKKKIVTMETTSDVIEILTGQSTSIRNEINQLTDLLNALESLKSEIVQVDAVDFKKFATILENIYMKNDGYWLVKYLDNDVLDMIEQRDTQGNTTGFAGFTEVANTFLVTAVKLQEEGVLPESKQGHEFAKNFWDALMSFTGGDFIMLDKINEQLKKSVSDKKYDKAMIKARQFMLSSLESYFGFEFFAEAVKLHDAGVPPNSEQAQELANNFWDWMTKLTGGDMTAMQEMSEQFEKNASHHMKKAHQYMVSALETYFKKGDMQYD
ncbi:MAG: MerR family transcriptional regulator [Defluviitaleaceae bacterium]|nr:MerR family transcriptional regulator [Defluviitaleaceae bacterium]